MIRLLSVPAASIDGAAGADRPPICTAAMVAVVQLVEHQVVILGVAGSSPVSHPTGRRAFSPSYLFHYSGTPCTVIATLCGTTARGVTYRWSLPCRGTEAVRNPPRCGRRSATANGASARLVGRVHTGRRMGLGTRLAPWWPVGIVVVLAVIAALGIYRRARTYVPMAAQPRVTRGLVGAGRLGNCRDRCRCRDLRLVPSARKRVAPVRNRRKLNVVLYSEPNPDVPQIHELIVRNFGTTPAYAITIEVEPPIKTAVGPKHDRNR